MIVLFGSSLSPRELAVCSSQWKFHSVFYKMWSIHVPCLHLRKRRVVWRSHAHLQEHVRCTDFSFHYFRSTLSTLGSCISERKGQKPLCQKMLVDQSPRRWQRLHPVSILCCGFLSFRESALPPSSIGSMLTSVQTSLRRLAVLFLTSLCRRVTKPPLLHDNASGTSNLEPHTHDVGSRSSAHPYLILMASRNSCFVGSNP